MKAELLSRLVEDRRNERAVVLATNLDTGEQLLLYPLEAESEVGDPEALGEAEHADAGPGEDGTEGFGAALHRAARSALLNDRSQPVDGPGGPFFLHVHNPPHRMVVVGAVHIAQPLAQMASHAGFSVSLVDPREAFNTQARFPGVDRVLSWPDTALADMELDHRTAVVTLTHDPKLDDPALATALGGPAFYIGALGSRKTHGRRLERMREAGFDEEALSRIRGPVGLDIGARTPGEIAAAILAEVIGELRRNVT